jgi:putative lipoic acid-binding regulatory protein
MTENPDEFFKRLHEELLQTSSWPSEYLFKFIVKSDLAKINAVKDNFDNIGAVIKTNPSKNGNYTSVSVNVIMTNPDQIIQKYKDVSHIEGIISL